MLSLPDFKEKQIVCLIAKRGVEQKLQFWNDNIRLLENGKPVNQVSCAKIFAVFIMGDFTITTYLIRKCKAFAISLFLLKNNFDLYAEILSEGQANYLLRDKQYHLKDEFPIAKQFVKNKLYNQLAFLSEIGYLAKPQHQYKKIAQAIDAAVNLKTLLGLEGHYTKNYFTNYFKEWDWYKREPRTKADITNVLMDIGYTFLFNFVEALLRLYGFDTYKGIYHQLFFQRKSLACDIIEPFRCIIDKHISKAYHLNQINKKDFFIRDGQYQLCYEKQQAYLEMFFTCIMNYKGELFSYVRDFYYAILNETRVYPFFKIDKPRV